MVATLETYQLKLPSFEGPLDVLLRLIEREQLPISDVSLLSVLDQFMAFAQNLGNSTLEVSAEFAVVAGRLSLLKSRALLPRPLKPVDDEGEVDLVLQLEEYRILRQAAAALTASLQRDEVSFERGRRVPLPTTDRPGLLPQAPEVLAKAVDRWFTRRPAKTFLLPSIRTVTLREMISRVLSILDRHSAPSFARVCATCTHRQEVVVAFLALLTLLRRRLVVADQNVLFGPISMRRELSITSHGTER